MILERCVHTIGTGRDRLLLPYRYVHLLYYCGFGPDLYRDSLRLKSMQLNE
jgi:hypothetical protein